jgi:hypothetical protein
VLRDYFPMGKIIGLAKAAGQALEDSGLEQEAVLSQLDAVRSAPGDFLADPHFAALARECIRRTAADAEPQPDELRTSALDYAVWGAEHIDPQAVAQMENALRLPVAAAGALMPDAHVGYGLPIGGVLATSEAVIPYAVGVDIACRMRLSVYPISPHVLGQRPAEFRRALLDQTRFGAGASWQRYERPEHAVLDDPAWEATRLLKSLQIKAQSQLGTSGTGNHFVEWGTFRLYADDETLGLQAGEYLALLSHSGSRGVGFKIANTYSELAVKLHPKLDASARHLSWLPLASGGGAPGYAGRRLAFARPDRPTAPLPQLLALHLPGSQRVQRVAEGPRARNVIDIGSLGVRQLCGAMPDPLLPSAPSAPWLVVSGQGLTAVLAGHPSVSNRSNLPGLADQSPFSATLRAYSAYPFATLRCLGARRRSGRCSSRRCRRRWLVSSRARLLAAAPGAGHLGLACLFHLLPQASVAACWHAKLALIQRMS